MNVSKTCKFRGHPVLLIPVVFVVEVTSDVSSCRLESGRLYKPLSIRLLHYRQGAMVSIAFPGATS